MSIRICVRRESLGESSGMQISFFSFFKGRDFELKVKQKLTASFQLFLQPADLTGPSSLGDALYLLRPGSKLQTGASPGIHNL